MNEIPSFNNHEAWLAWRRLGVGASDTPIILGLSKHKSAFELFEEKTGRKPGEQTTNFVIEKGIRLEPIARQKFAARYNLLNDCDETFQPRLVQIAELPFMRASLDGASYDGELIIEIKYQGAKAHAEVATGLIQSAYYAQIQHQLLVSGAKRANLVSINDDEQIVTTVVERDERFMQEILDRATEFWEWVRLNRWPGESVDEALLNDLQTIEGLSLKIKELETWKKRLQDRVFATGAEVCGDWRINTITRKGNVQYNKIPELEGVDLERYRAKASVFKTITKC